jgi:sulfatase modifying factor 1
MSRVIRRRAAWLIAGGFACVQALGGCEVVLGVGNLRERNGSGSGSGASADGTGDATTGMGSGNTLGSDSNESGAGMGSGADADAVSGESAGAAAGGASGVDAGASATGSSTGSAGQSAGAPSGSSGSSGVTVCTGSMTECTSDTQVAMCNASGQWGVPTTCANACVGTVGTVGGNCGGVCVPNATQCVSNGVETCGPNGTWGSPWACATGSCTAGACTGSTADSSTPSCATGGPGMSNCGANSESCCTSLEVPGGTYYRTYENLGGGPNGEYNSATVSGFRLDKYLVTVGRFRQFVNHWNGDIGYAPLAGSGKHTHLNGGNGLAATGGGYEPGWVATDDSQIAPTNANLACDSYSTWTDSAGARENLPINCVNWWESYAFCIWDGGFLPSETEWEYAAAGGNQQREYPWGSTAPGTVNQYAIFADSNGNCYYPSDAVCLGVANIAPVGTATLGGGLFGQLDLTGDLREWNLDWYAAYAAECTDCADFTASSDRVVRAGDFLDDALNLLSPIRSAYTPTDRYSSIGFRCARTP